MRIEIDTIVLDILNTKSFKNKEDITSNKVAHIMAKTKTLFANCFFKLINTVRIHIMNKTIAQTRMLLKNKDPSLFFAKREIGIVTIERGATGNHNVNRKIIVHTNFTKNTNLRIHKKFFFIFILQKTSL